MPDEKRCAQCGQALSRRKGETCTNWKARKCCDGSHASRHREEAQAKKRKRNRALKAAGALLATQLAEKGAT